MVVTEEIKLTNGISVPPTLDMDEFLMPIPETEAGIRALPENRRLYARQVQAEKLKGTRYELYGSVYHTGGSGAGENSGGHYYSQIKIGDRWWNFNDASVTEISAAELPTVWRSRIEHAVALFYRRLPA